MKRILFLASMLLMSMGIFAQEVTTLTFTAKQQNNTYQQLDSVVVTNLTKDWTEVIYYPDTLLLMNTVGITDWENSKGSVKLYQNIPNPFHGITDFNLTLANKEKVELVIFDINGKKVAEYHNTLPSGEHMFRATMNTPQTYLLSAVTKNGNTSIKMINLSNTGAQAHIEYVSSKPLDMDMTKKQSQNPFSKGDNMKYVGYATQNDGSHNAEVTQTQQGSETITFTFPTAKPDPIVEAFTDTATTITLNSAVLNGRYNVLYAEVEELGFEYRKSDTTEYTSVFVTNKKTPFNFNLVGLESGTEYLFKAFVKADSTLVYGEEKSFTTEKVKETKVITGDATDINKRGATLHGSYELGNEELMMVGFDYKVKGTEDWKQIISSGKDTPFEANIENQLEPETECVYRAFAYTSVYTQINGEEKSFKTLEKSAELPTVITDKAETGTYKDMGAKIYGNLVFDGDCEMKERGFFWGKDANPKDNGKKEIVELGTEKSFSFETGILEPSTTYYYVAYATNEKGIAYGEVKKFTIRDAKELAKLVVNNVAVYSTSAIVESEVISTGETITERGICFCNTGEPTIADNKLVDAETGIGVFISNMDSLKEGTEYKVKAYAISWAGVAYSETKTFTTLKLEKPAVTTDSVININVDAATVFSTLTAKGGSANVVVGVVVSKEHKLPTIEQDTLFVSTLDDATFTTRVRNLESGIKYYVRAYAKNEAGEAYGEVKEFTTLGAFVCGNNFADIEGNIYTTVKIGHQCWMKEDLRVKTMPNGSPISKISEGSMPTDFTVGNYWCYEREDEHVGHSVYYPWSTASNVSSNKDQEAKIQGICPDGWYLPTCRDYNILFNYLDSSIPIDRIYGTANVTINSSSKLGIRLALPQSEGHWLNYTGPGYVGPNDHSRAGGSDYANTPNTPGYNFPNYTDEEYNASGFSAKPKGYVYRQNGMFYFNGTLNAWTSYSPSVVGTAFCVKIAMNVVGATFSTYSDIAKDFYSVRCIKMPEQELPSVITNEVGTITASTAGISGKIDFNGYADITEKGFYYGETQNVKEEGTKVVVESATDAFETVIINLKSKTTYYVAAFATNIKGEVLGEVKTFTTLNNAVPATVRINGTEELKAGSVKVNCEVMEDGGEPVTERGLCWNTTTNPTPKNSTKKDIQAGVGEYTIAVDGLTPNTTYYFRAYAITIKDTAYSDNYIVNIPEAKVPVVKTDSLNNIVNSGATVFASIIDKGNLDIIECGVVFDTITNSTNARKVVAKTITDNFSVDITGLKEETTYYVKAFATNASGTAYGDELSFTTLANLSCGGYIQDIEGNSYKTVKIGTQCWMQENLRTHTYADNTKLETGVWDVADTQYGLGTNTYYNWTTATRQNNVANQTYDTKVQGICPDGWRIPSYSDFHILCKTVDPDIDFSETTVPSTVGNQTVESSNHLAIKLAKAHQNWAVVTVAAKEGSPAWATANDMSDYNKSGFSALPCGYTNKGSGSLTIGPEKTANYCAFVTANSSAASNANGRIFSIRPNNTGVTHERSNTHGWTVRCVMDELVQDEP